MTTRKRNLPTSSQRYIGKRIKQARTAKRLSLREMADRFGTSHSAIRDYERGETKIGVPALQKFSEILGKPIAWFVPGWWLNADEVDPDTSRLAYQIARLPQADRTRVLRLFRATLALLRTRRARQRS